MIPSHAQHAFLNDALHKLHLNRETLAGRIGVPRKALDGWMASEESADFQLIPKAVKKFISTMLHHETIQPFSKQSALRDRISADGKPQLLSVDQFSRESVEALFRVADIMQPIARRQKVSRILEGAVLGNLFFEASTRTRVSFGAAFCRLGGSVCDTTGFTFSSMAKGESIYDTSRVMSGYVDVLVVRHPDLGSVHEFACATNIPVINGGDGPGEHPSQALLDLYTIQTEFARLNKKIDGSHIALVGDLKHGRTVHSLIKLLALYRDLKFSLVSPESLEMPSYILEQVARNGHVIEQSTSLTQSLPGVDVVYATRVQKERFTNPDEMVKGYTPDFQINKALIDAYCSQDTVVMHPLPRDSRAEANDLSTDLNHDSRLAIFRQADNGIPVRMAIFAVLLGVEHLVERSLRDTTWHHPCYIGVDDAPFYSQD